MSNDEDIWFQFCRTEEQLKKTARKVHDAKLFDDDARRHYMKKRRELNQRKLRVLHVGRETVLKMFITSKHYPRQGYWLELDDGPFPDDVHVAEVYYNHERGCFSFLLRSRRFPPVYLGEIIPSMTGENLRMRCFIYPADEAQAIVQYVVTCRSNNTEAWMKGLAERLNAYLDAFDDTGRVSFEDGGLTIKEPSSELAE